MSTLTPGERTDGRGDALAGGAGQDQLIDGADAGADVYSFAGSFGADTITDASYDGTIWFDGLGAIPGSGAHIVAAISRRHLPLLAIDNWSATARQVLR